jgi:hypothetical protein
MKAARQVIGWLWAAVWVRWRLMRVRAVRLFGGRRDVGGLDYHLSPAETPVEGLDYDAAELPAGMVARLEAARAELSHRASKEPVPSIRSRVGGRRVASLAAAALLTVGAVGAGAAVIVTGSTGVPAVDRVLGTYDEEPAEPGAYGGVGRDLDPLSPRSSASVGFSLGSRRMVNTSYVAGDGRVCSILADRDDDEPVADLVCIHPMALAESLGSSRGIVLAVSDEERALVRGFVVAGVATLSGQGPNESLDVHLGETWTPSVPGVGPVKPFVAVGHPGPSGDGVRGEGFDPLDLANPANYTFDAVLNDGERVRIDPQMRAP